MGLPAVAASAHFFFPDISCLARSSPTESNRRTRPSRVLIPNSLVLAVAEQLCPLSLLRLASPVWFFALADEDRSALDFSDAVGEVLAAPLPAHFASTNVPL